MTLEKILSAKVLIVINLLIIVAAELTGDLFLQTGLIHIIALLFLLLGISRLFINYNAFDPYLRPLTLGAIAALLLFAFSHLTEYFSFNAGGGSYSDELYVDVTNLYMTAMLLVALGAHYFLARQGSTRVPVSVLAFAFLASCVVTVLGFTRLYNISIEPDEPDIYVYAVVVVGVTVYSILKILKLGRVVSIMRSFALYIAVAFVLVAAAALHYLLYELLEHAGMSELQIVYVGHFFFYAGLSFMFLAFPRLARLGGIYGK